MEALTIAILYWHTIDYKMLDLIYKKIQGYKLCNHLTMLATTCGKVSNTYGMPNIIFNYAHNIKHAPPINSTLAIPL